MSETVICGEGQNSYEVRISSYPNRREKLRRAFNTRGKTGEDLVSTIVASGGVRSVDRYKDGEPNDGPAGEPAYQRLYWNKAVDTIMHFKNGKRNDSITGAAAEQSFSREGVLLYAARYSDEKISDGADGTPAQLQYNQNGQTKMITRFRDGHLSDGKNGEAAIEMYNESGALFGVVFRGNGVPDPAAGGGLMPHASGVLRTSYSYVEKTLTAPEALTAYAKQFGIDAPVAQQETPAPVTETKISGLKFNIPATITCGEGQDSYQVNIFSSYSNRRQKLRRAFDVRGNAGEDLVSAIVASGGVTSVNRLKDGQYNDGPNGEPAEQNFDYDGTKDWHYKDGQLTSIVRFHDNGQVKSVRRYKNDRIHDATNGEAAIEDYDRNGGLIKVGRSDGTRNPHPKDYSDVVVKKYLDTQEIAAYAAKFNKALPTPTQEPPAAGTKTKTSWVRKIVSGLKRRL